jgi:transcriptional regulator with XRE-family HTH domain
MKSNEFKSKMILMGFTQRTISEKLGVSERTIARWLNETIIPKMAILALHALEVEFKKGIEL